MTGHEYYKYKQFLHKQYDRLDSREVSFVYHTLWNWMDEEDDFVTMFDSLSESMRQYFRNVIPLRYLYAIEKDSYTGILQSFDEVRAKSNFDKSLKILPFTMTEEQLVIISGVDHTSFSEFQRYFVRRLFSYRLLMTFGYKEEQFFNIYLLPSEYEKLF